MPCSGVCALPATRQNEYRSEPSSEPDNCKQTGFLGPNFVNIAATTKLMALLYLQLGLKKPLRYFIWSDSTSYTSYGR